MTLKQEKYTSDERAKRAEAGYADMKKQLENMNKEMAKMSKAVAKSKKVQDVQVMIEQHEVELDEIRNQNNALMKNLAEISTTNERLQRDNDKFKASSASAATNAVHEKDALAEQLKALRTQYEHDVAQFKATINKLTDERNDAERKYSLSLSKVRSTAPTPPPVVVIPESSDASTKGEASSANRDDLHAKIRAALEKALPTASATEVPQTESVASAPLNEADESVLIDLLAPVASDGLSAKNSTNATATHASSAFTKEAIDDLADVLTQLVPLTSNTPAPQAPQNTEEIDALKEANAEIRLLLEKSEQRLADKSLEFEEASVKLLQFESEIRQLVHQQQQQSSEAASHSNKQLQDQITALEEKLRKKQASFLSLQQDFDTMVATKEKELASLHQEKEKEFSSHISKESESKSKEIAALQAGKAAEISAAVDKTTKSYETKIKDLTVAYDAKVKEISTSYESKLTAAAAANDLKIKETVTANDAKIKDLVASVDGKSKEIAALSKRKEEFEAEVRKNTDKQQQLTKAQAQITQFEEQTKKTQVQITQYEDQIKKNQAQREDIFAKLTASDAKCGELEAKISAISGEYERATNRIQKLEADLVEMTELKKTLEAMKADINRFAKENADLSSSHKLELAKLEAQYKDEMKKAEEAFAVQNNASQSKLSQQQKELDTFKDLKKQFEKAQGEQKYIADANSLLQSTIKDLEASLVALQKSFLAEKEDLEAKLKASEASGLEQLQKFQQLQDSIQETAVASELSEKRQAALIRDLRRQLKFEQRRADNSSVYSGPTSPATPRGHQRSISNASRDVASRIHDASSQNASDMVTDSEQAELIFRLANLQKEKSDLNDKVRGLESQVAQLTQRVKVKEDLIELYTSGSVMSNSANPPSPKSAKKKLDPQQLYDMNQKLKVMLEESQTENGTLKRQLQRFIDSKAGH